MSDLLTDDWLPSGVLRRDGEPCVEWCYVGGRRLSEPFFSQTVEKCLQSRVNRAPRPQTSLETLGEIARQRPGLTPTGFIFHMSRCVSTLLAQMLAALLQNIVLSEAEQLDAVLRAVLDHRRNTTGERIPNSLACWLASGTLAPR